MVKRAVYLDAQRDEIVKRLAREGKTSQMDVIRRAITAYAEANGAKISADMRRVMEHLEKYPDSRDVVPNGGRANSARP